MNGISATPPGPHPGDDNPGVEAELTRRLHDLGTTTVGDVDRTWEQIQARVAGRAGGDAGPRWAPGWGGRRLLLAAAAVTVLAAGIAVVSRAGQGDGDRGVRIGNQTTTSDRLPVPDPPRHPSRTTTTTAAPTGSPAGTAPPAGQTPGQAPAGEEQQSGGAGDPGGPASGDPTEATGSDVPRVAAEISILYPEYWAEIVYADATFYFRREDDVGSTRPGPDAYGHVDSATWGTVSGRRCLTSGGGEYAFPDAPTRALSYGLLGDDIEVVEIVMADGRRQRGNRWHHVEPGLRMWYTQRPLGQVDRIEGLDAAGGVVATIADPDGDHGSAQC
jgi:hypothetical protein